MNPVETSGDAVPMIALRLHLFGLVQGIGLRPTIARIAQRLSLNGFVINTSSGVEVHVEGVKSSVDKFATEWPTLLPDAAVILSSHCEFVLPLGFDSFDVVVSLEHRDYPTDVGAHDQRSRLSVRVPADVAICHECLSEIQDAHNVRQGHPFTSCTTCGPRYSIIETMPYERSRTSMAEFGLCNRCRVEYESPADRRFHAQTNSCPNCGPQIWIRNTDGQTFAHHEDALQAAASAILKGQIVALRGIGGYQLLVDATSQIAVERLRERKHRYGKPLAVMSKSIAGTTDLACLDDLERKWLSSPAGPIVIAQASARSPIAASVSHGLNTIGLMLPTTALHWLLLHAVARPIVCTSGNRDGEPIVFSSEQAFSEFQGIADVWLEHDRPIVRPVDDSVVRVMAGKTVGIRLARGFAPLSLQLDAADVMIAHGGHQKVSIALSNGAQAILGPHVGDLETVASRKRFIEQRESLSKLFDIENEQAVCDLHPDYFTSCLLDVGNNSVIKVQHHHAHVVAGMIEQGWLKRKVLGVAFDGTGYGTDGTIWGGEFMQVTTTRFERVGHLRPFPVIGGELAIRQPWRVAVALVNDAVGAKEAAALQFLSGSADQLLPVMRRPALSPRTTSAGRLFDGIATLILGIESCQFEGQAAMLLESTCDLTAAGQYHFIIQESLPKVVDWRPVVRQVLNDRQAGVHPATMAMRFHRGLACAIFDFCRDSSLPVVLSGGVFQNRTLVELLAERFSGHDHEVGFPSLIPPNDGGLAAGQLAIGLALARQRRTASCA
jgi:hydrogenase maturation protein HypF